MTNISYALCETVADLMALFVEEETLPSDSRETVRLTIEWAEAFEDRYAHEDWRNRDYMEEVETFFRERYREWLDSAGSRSVRICL